MKVYHPLSDVPFSVLRERLYEAVENKQIFVKEKGVLRLFSYLPKCNFEKDLWTVYTRSARGLIIDVANEKIVALPFPKFFNHNEVSEDELKFHSTLPCSIYDKADGSLGIVYLYEGSWRVATKGSFDSEQAALGQRILDSLLKQGLNLTLSSFCTHMFEIVGPSNKIVVDYPEDMLIYLGSYHNITKEELFFGDEIQKFIDSRDLKSLQVVQQFNSFNNINEIVSSLDQIPSSREGYVVKFSNGHRIKFKGKEYLKLHKHVFKIDKKNIAKFILELTSTKLPNIEEVVQAYPEEFKDQVIGWVYDIYQDIHDYIVAHTREYYLFRNNIINNPKLRRAVYVDYCKQKSNVNLSLAMKIYDSVDEKELKIYCLKHFIKNDLI